MVVFSVCYVCWKLNQLNDRVLEELCEGTHHFKVGSNKPFPLECDFTGSTFEPCLKWYHWKILEVPIFSFNSQVVCKTNWDTMIPRLGKLERYLKFAENTMEVLVLALGSKCMSAKKAVSYPPVFVDRWRTGKSPWTSVSSDDTFFTASVYG